jgi:hypothetical protein
MAADTLPRKIIELNVLIVQKTARVSFAAISTVAGGAGRVLGVSRDAGKTVTGQTRSAADRTATSAGTGAKEVVGQTRVAAERTIDTARTGANTVAGQARSAADRTASTARSSAREVSGQAEAQGERVSRAVSSEANRAVDRATQAVDDMPGRGTPYEEWTKDQLYQRAQELEIEGRASMNKSELIDALRS